MCASLIRAHDAHNRQNARLYVPHNTPTTCLSTNKAEKEQGKRCVFTCCTGSPGPAGDDDSCMTT
eukprot:2573-Eustigmatos_ZCMA.PRE.1